MQGFALPLIARLGLSARVFCPPRATPDQFAAQISGDLASWAKLIKAVNVKVD